jgi:hypothetical protein
MNSKVHAVDAGDHRRHRQHRGPGGELLHDLVLPHRDEREVRLERGGEELALVVDALVDADDVIVDVPEVKIEGRSGRRLFFAPRLPILDTAWP